MLFYTLLPKLINMSLTAGVAIVFVLLLRLLLKRAPKVISYALWGIVLIRLLCPISIESGVSLFGLMDTPVEERGENTGSIEYVPNDIVNMDKPTVALPIPGVSDVINDALPKGEEKVEADTMERGIRIATYAWIAGVLGMAIYAAVSYIRLRRKLITASPMRDNIWYADEITSPFVLGLISPKIYIPSSMPAQEQSYIILHEQHHIRRFDHVIKAVAFAALCIHWFNPLVWVAFIMAGKDMEMSCDEAVVKKLGEGVLADYTASLLSLATGRHIIAGAPLAFGEGDTKGRIRNLANWKKPAFWVILAAVIVCAVSAVCLLTNPTGDDITENPPDDEITENPTDDDIAKNPPDDDITENVEFSFYGPVFYYGEQSFDINALYPTVDAVVSAERVGDKIVVEGHSGPNNSLYLIFNTATKDFEKRIIGAGLTWHSNDLSTAVYLFWSTVRAYDGTLIKEYTLEQDEWIDELSFSENNRVLEVLILSGSKPDRVDRIELDSIG